MILCYLKQGNIEESFENKAEVKMALSNEQVVEAVELFVNNFALEKNEEKRLRLFQCFGDVFGKGITGWKDMAFKIMEERDLDHCIVKEYMDLISPKKEVTCEYEIREMVESVRVGRKRPPKVA